MSAFLDYQDRSTCILFGDGAGAAVVASEGEGWQIDTLCLGSDGEAADSGEDSRRRLALPSVA